MSLTGQQLLVGMSKFMKDYWASTTTSNGASDGTTLIDTALGRYGDDALRGFYARITGAGGTQYQVRRVWRSTGSSGTLEVIPAFSAQVGTATTYELHRYDPAGKFLALDEARLLVYPDLAKFVYDDTTTADGVSTDYPIPTSIRKGPAFVFGENPKSRTVDWNFITNPQDDTLGSWTATNITASLVTREYSDLLVPKFGTQCIKLVVAGSANGTYVQAVAAMRNGITAARAAGRTMTYARWVYSLTPTKWTLKITDDSGTSTGAAHTGNGWELLTVTRDISPTNATTLTVTLDADNDSTATVAYVNGAWFYFGEKQRVEECYDDRIIGRVRRDDNVQQVFLFETPPRGAQLRFVGRAPLSLLGDTIATQVTNTMEIDEPSAHLLYAEAASNLFEGEGLVAAMPDELLTKVAVARRNRNEYAVRWPFRMPASAALKGWT